jgi:GMP synthase-like glutamine amidotransferase
LSGLVLQNDDCAPPALFGDWVVMRGIPFSVCDVRSDGVPEDPTAHDWVAVLGSRRSVNDRERPWIRAEIELLARAVEADVPTLGICFGGQALAAALGGEVSDAELRADAFGWVETRTSAAEIVSPGPWVHLNTERFSLPPSAELLAESPTGPSAFRLGPHLGVQFHPEATEALAERWALDMTEVLERAGVTVDQIRKQGRLHAPAASARAFALFDAWWAEVAAPSGRRS